MKVPTYLHRNSFDIYYFRIAVPAKYRQYIGRSELKKSLRTTSFSVAVRRAYIIAGKAFELLEKASAMINDDWMRLKLSWAERMNCYQRKKCIEAAIDKGSGLTVNDLGR